MPVTLSDEAWFWQRRVLARHKIRRRYTRLDGSEINLGHGEASRIECLILKALGHRSTVLPGFLSTFLVYSMVPLPRWARVRIIGRVMAGMTHTGTPGGTQVTGASRGRQRQAAEPKVVFLDSPPPIRRKSPGRMKRHSDQHDNFVEVNG